MEINEVLQQIKDVMHKNHISLTSSYETSNEVREILKEYNMNNESLGAISRYICNRLHNGIAFLIENIVQELQIESDNVS